MISKKVQYAGMIVSQLGEMFQEDCDLHIDDLHDDDNLTEFFTAMLTATTHVYNHITGDEKTELEFNHLQNQLFFQSKLNEKQEEK